jgi:hypothetical protein
MLMFLNHYLHNHTRDFLIKKKYQCPLAEKEFFCGFQKLQLALNCFTELEIQAQAPQLHLHLQP